MVLNRLGQFRMESTGYRGTRTIPVPGNGNQIYKEPEQFLFHEVGNQINKKLEWSGSGTKVLDSELVLVLKRGIDLRLIGGDLIMG